MDEYEIILNSAAIVHAGRISVGEMIKLYEPWTIVRGFCKEASGKGILIGNDLILKVCSPCS